MIQKPLILVTNDDGITAQGIQNLVEVVSKIGEVVVVAPNKPQSGMGQAITIGHPLRLTKSSIFGEIQAYECSGTPADCVKLARYNLFKSRRPALVVSGINHGANSSISVIYSGTMSAAVEAAIEGIPAIGFSLDDFSHHADFSHTHTYIDRIVRQVLAESIPEGIALNVNFPKNEAAIPIKGIKVCRQTKGHWGEEFEERTDPYNKSYFWLTGKFINQDSGEDTDEWALANGYVTVVPCQADLTAHHLLEKMRLMF